MCGWVGVCILEQIINLHTEHSLHTLIMHHCLYYSLREMSSLNFKQNLAHFY